MSHPVLIDFFCKAGGASMGYHRAGFRVIGVDKDPQPNYPFQFVRGDAIDLFDEMVWIYRPAAVAGSPPCWKHSRLRTRTQREYADFIPQFREKCRASGLPYVIENVEGAPLIDPILICGSMLRNARGELPIIDDLLLKRHRLFESNLPLEPPAADLCQIGKRAGWWRAFIDVHGGGGQRETRLPDGRRSCHGNKASESEAARLMGIDWMTAEEKNQAIPPVYTEYVGRALTAHLSGQPR